jgi:hypothetical protein
MAPALQSSGRPQEFRHFRPAQGIVAEVPSVDRRRFRLDGAIGEDGVVDSPAHDARSGRLLQRGTGPGFLLISARLLTFSDFVVDQIGVALSSSNDLCFRTRNHHLRG